MSYLREDPQARQKPVLPAFSLQAVRISRQPRSKLACGPWIMNARCESNNPPAEPGAFDCWPLKGA